MPAWITSRRLSVLVAVAYLIGISFFAQPKSAKALLGNIVTTVIWLLFPLACIWFGDEMGEYVGVLPGPAINRRSPGWMVKVGGWILLFLPVVVWWFAYR